MATTPIPDILNSIVDYLNALTLDSTTFTRSYFPKKAVEELEPGVFVGIVFPANDASSLIDRSNVGTIRVFNIVVYSRVDGKSYDTGADSFVNLVSGIRDELNKELRGSTSLLPGGIRLSGVNIDPIYDFEELANNNTLRAIISLITREDQSAV